MTIHTSDYFWVVDIHVKGWSYKYEKWCFRLIRNGAIKRWRYTMRKEHPDVLKFKFPTEEEALQAMNEFKKSRKWKTKPKNKDYIITLSCNQSFT